MSLFTKFKYFKIMSFILYLINKNHLQKNLYIYSYPMFLFSICKSAHEKFIFFNLISKNASNFFEYSYIIDMN